MLHNYKKCLTLPVFGIRFSGISREFGRVIVRSLARRSQAETPTAEPIEPDMPPMRSKQGSIGIHHIWSSEHDIAAISGK